jgi:cephalosporin hydroxylase
MNRGERLPPPVHADLTDTVLDYWMARVAQHEHDWYAGVRLLKFPEDLRAYEHLIWASRASVVIELGARFGGSALWFRDRLRTLQSYGLIERPLVLSIDIEPDLAREGVLKADPSSDDTTLAALQGFTWFVQPSGFFVVEDGCVDIDELRLKPDWPRGVLPALTDWLATEQGRDFTVREDLELYGISCHPSGFLQRVG